MTHLTRSAHGSSISAVDFARRARPAYFRWFCIRTRAPLRDNDEACSSGGEQNVAWRAGLAPPTRSCLTCRAMHALILMNEFRNRSVFLFAEVVLTRFLFVYFSLLQQGISSAFDGSQQAFTSDATEMGRSVSRNAYSRLSTDDNFLRSIFSSLSSRCVILAGVMLPLRPNWTIMPSSNCRHYCPRNPQLAHTPLSHAPPPSPPPQDLPTPGV